MQYLISLFIIDQCLEINIYGATTKKYAVKNICCVYKNIYVKFFLRYKSCNEAADLSVLSLCDCQNKKNRVVPKIE